MRRRLCTIASKEDERAEIFFLKKPVKSPKVCLNNNIVDSEEPVVSDGM
jgi:hypothetical protein